MSSHAVRSPLLGISASADPVQGLLFTQDLSPRSRQRIGSKNTQREPGGMRICLRRLAMLILNLLVWHEPLVWLVGRLNRRLRFLNRVFVAYPVTQEYADAYAYRWVQQRCRWSPWLAGLYWQSGRAGLITVISATEEDFYHPADPAHNRPYLEALLRRTERLRQLLSAEEVSFSGILPALLQARGLRPEGPELEVTVETVLQAEAKFRAELGLAEGTPLILLGGKGYIGRRLTERLAQRETYVVDILPGRRVNNETWPHHLHGTAAILINLTRKAVLSDYMHLFWKELVVLNEVYPEPSAEELTFLSRLGVRVSHVVGVKARAWPRFPRAYDGGIPCCAAWKVPEMDVLLSYLNGNETGAGGVRKSPLETRPHAAGSFPLPRNGANGRRKDGWTGWQGHSPYPEGTSVARLTRCHDNGWGGAIGDGSLSRMFWSRIEHSGNLPAQLVKRGGQWHTLTWAQVGEIVRELALGLLALGRKPGDAVALLSQSRAEWVQADFAILSVGAVTVPIYPTYPPEQIAYILSDSEACTLIVEDANQLTKVLEVRGKLDRLEQIVVIQGDAGLDPSVLTWGDLRLRGRAQAERLKSRAIAFEAAIRHEDPATIVYTSGTTGVPKGVVQTHGNHLAALNALAQVTPVEPGDIHLLFLPLAHSFGRLESFIGIHRGLTTAFAEHLDKLADNLREVRPHFICGIPRVFEKLYAKILAGIEASSPLKRTIFSWALGVGRGVSKRGQTEQPIPGSLKLKRRVAYALVFSKLHQALGGRLRFAAAGGAPLPREIAEFFHAIGLPILEGYGLTETCPALTFNRLDRFKFGSVGQALPGVELRIASDGEVLARGPNIATRGYLKKPEATAEVFEPDGWFHTGDIGWIDEEGFLFITDRKKDLIVTSGGMNIAPQQIENLLKSDRLLSDVVVYGDRRPYPVALIPVSRDELAKFARELGVFVTDHAELTKHPKVVERVRRTIEETNAKLASYARIKRFALLPADFTHEGGELTPTLKLKRKSVADKYKDLLDSLYR